MDFEELGKLIKSRLEDAEVRITDLTGTRDHLGITVISDEFQNKRPLARHQIIMDILKPKLKEEIHAVQLKTLTYEAAKSSGLI